MPSSVEPDQSETDQENECENKPDFKRQSEIQGKLEQMIMRLEDSLKAKQPERDPSVRKLEYEELARVRQHELAMMDKKNENIRLVTESDKVKLEIERVRAQRELATKDKENEKIRLIIEMEKIKLEIEKQKAQNRKIQSEENDKARAYKLKMAELRCRELEAEETIQRARNEEQQLAGKQKKELLNQSATRKMENQKQNERATLEVRNATMVTGGIAVVSGAVSGGLGGASAVGAAAAVVGAATVLAPVAGTIAVATGVSYAYRLAASTT